jgi:endoglucanase
MPEFNLNSFLNSLLSTSGLSGFEAPVRTLIAKAWEPLVDELVTTPLGSLHGNKPGCSASSRPKIMLAAHMDAIGMMVTTIQQEFLHVTGIGGLDPRILPGQPVIVHGKQDLLGIIAQPPDHLLPPAHKGSPAPLEWLLVDIGLEAGQVSELVKPGDPISFANLPVQLSDDVVSGHSLDNRASVAALTLCLHELKTTQHDWDVVAVATSQEEETFGGSYTSSFDVLPDIAVAIDVTFAKSPGVSDYNTFELGKGVALGFGPNIHPAIHRSFKDLCARLDIPYHLDVMPAHSGTDAYALQMAANGVPTMVLSIPLRYMHTPVETVHLKDIQRAGHLLAEFIAHLDTNYIDNIHWD